MKNFSLVNPFITGSLNTSYESKSAMDAAKTLYMRVAKHFKNNVPKFNFTITDESDKLYHFNVSERKSGKEVNFTITPTEMSKKNEEVLKKVIKQKQEEKVGGKKDKFMKVEESDDDSSSSSSSSDSYSPRAIPLYVDPIREFLYTPYYTYDVVDPIIIDYPSWYIPSIVLTDGYFITYGP